MLKTEYKSFTKAIFKKNFTQFNGFKKKIYPLSYYLSPKHINMAIVSAITFYCISRYLVARLNIK